MSSGFFGKIPAHGDFIERNLARSFVTSWDDWLQRCVAASREQLGQQWLDVYLTSPIWRFVLSIGAVDSQSWAGILVPSVDSVGRYYPLTISQSVPGNTNPFQFQADNNEWYTLLEDAAIRCLQNGLNADELMQALSNAPPSTDKSLNIVSVPKGIISNGQIVRSKLNGINSSYAELMHQTLSLQFESQSIWWSQGSQNMKPTLIRLSGLPLSSQFSAFLDGNWETWGRQ